MLNTTHPLELLARLFSYPDEGLLAAVKEAHEHGGGEAAGVGTGAFLAAMGERTLPELEELYIQAFDMNPDVCLDIGWHLFGEDYARGEFLVKVRQELRKYGLEEKGELPDHITCILPLMARMPEEESRQFGETFLLHALRKIEKAIGEENPYRHLLAALGRRLADSTQTASRTEGIIHD